MCKPFSDSNYKSLATFSAVRQALLQDELETFTKIRLYCSASIADGGPTIQRHRVNVLSCMPREDGYYLYNRNVGQLAN